MPPPAVLSQTSFEHAAWLLRCEVAMLRAIAEVESGPLGPFLATGEPVILFERHVFNRLTERQYIGAKVATLPPAYNTIAADTRGGYGPVSAQHTKLDAAVKLDRVAALKSASWGLFQIMGENHARCGYDHVQRFVTAMIRSADDHLRALTMFIRTDSKLLDAVRSKNFPMVARIYNGKQYRDNLWDTKIETAYYSNTDTRRA